jgi:hypothetical protein
MPNRAELPMLGIATRQLIESNSTAMIDKVQFRKEADKLRQERESKGKGSIYSLMQPFYRPEIEELLNKRIDVLYAFYMGNDGGQQLRWCQGTVIEVYKDSAKSTVLVSWDEMPDVEGYEDKRTVSKQVLLPSKWNKNTVNAWRMDVNIEMHKSGNDKEVTEYDCDVQEKSDFDSSESEPESEIASKGII